MSVALDERVCAMRFIKVESFLIKVSDIFHCSKYHSNTYKFFMLTVDRNGQPLFSFRNGQLMFLVNKGHPAAVALALIGQPAPLARRGQLELGLKNGQADRLDTTG